MHTCMCTSVGCVGCAPCACGPRFPHWLPTFITVGSITKTHALPSLSITAAWTVLHALRPGAGEEGGAVPQEHDGQARQLCSEVRQLGARSYYWFACSTNSVACKWMWVCVSMCLCAHMLDHLSLHFAIFVSTASSAQTSLQGEHLSTLHCPLHQLLVARGSRCSGPTIRAVRAKCTQLLIAGYRCCAHGCCCCRCRPVISPCSVHRARVACALQGFHHQLL